MAEDDSYALPIFCICCAMAGVLFVLLDAVAYLMKRESGSMLGLRHGKWTVLHVLLWAVGAFIVGFFGQVLDIFELKRQATITIGLCWYPIYIQIVDMIEKRNITQDETKEL